MIAELTDVFTLIVVALVAGYALVTVEELIYKRLKQWYKIWQQHRQRQWFERWFYVAPSHWAKAAHYGMIQGDPTYFMEGTATAEEYKHAIEVMLTNYEELTKDIKAGNIFACQGCNIRFDSIDALATHRRDEKH